MEFLYTQMTVIVHIVLKQMFICVITKDKAKRQRGLGTSDPREENKFRS